jgi:hypothetical protein
MTNLWSGNKVVSVSVEASDTIGSIAQVTHYTTDEVVDIINDIIREDRKKHDTSREES